MSVIGPVQSRYIESSSVGKRRRWERFVEKVLLPVRPGLVQKSITSPGSDWYQSGPMAAMLGGVDIGTPSATNVHASH